MRCPRCRRRPQAVEYFQQAVAFDDKDGHTWEELAYCYLMINDLQNSYTAYQHALYHIQNPKVRPPPATPVRGPSFRPIGGNFANDGTYQPAKPRVSARLQVSRKFRRVFTQDSARVSSGSGSGMCLHGLVLYTRRARRGVLVSLELTPEIRA